MKLLSEGLLIPFLGKRQLPVDRDGKIVNTGKVDLLEESSRYYVEIWAIEWLGLGFPLWPFSPIWDRTTGRPLESDANNCTYE